MTKTLLLFIHFAQKLALVQRRPSRLRSIRSQQHIPVKYHLRQAVNGQKQCTPKRKMAQQKTAK